MTRRSTDLGLLAVAAVWGSSYLATKEIASPDTVFALLGVRFTLATAVLTVVLCHRLAGVTRPETVSGVVGGILLAAVCVAETYGVTMTSASNAGLIMALTMVATPMLQRHRVSRHFYFAAALAVIGCGLLTQSAGLTAPRAGDIVIGVAALLRAVHVTVMARMAEANETDSARTTLVQLLTVAAVTLAAVTLAVSVVSGQSVPAMTAAYGAADWMLIGYLAVACTVFAFLLQLRALGTTSPARVSLLLGTEPLWAAVIGVTVAGDPVTGAGLAGAALVVAGTTRGRMVVTSPASASRQLRVGLATDRAALPVLQVDGHSGVL
ncbi:DMT family transporter [Mycolicibacterium porcinum]|uniref:DMT family transporter n=1 Tax=Mycolicibacterium porcinum TaxID=39693 RepID=A0ABV3VAA6_9MYCO